MEWTEIIVLIVVGMILIAVDFYLPGFVLATIGAVLMLVALFFCFQKHGLYVGLGLFALEVALGAGAAYLSIYCFPKTAAGRRMILAEAQTGMRAQAEQTRDLIGREGVAQTVLRPSGVAVVDGKRLDVMAESGMIERNSAIKVIAVDDNRIVVRKN